jgi:Glycosyl transferase family 11
MFQISVVYGLAEKFKEFPEFPYYPYFNLPKRTQNVEHLFVQPGGVNILFDIKNESNLCLVGFFQKHEFFDHIKEKLIKEVFKVPLDYQPDTIGVHVRRTDFLFDPINFPTQPVEYYKKAFEKIGIENKKVVFCSDDIEWCIENFSYLPNVKFRKYTSALSDIYFLANCESVVMSNSTFSFWGAYLNMKERQIYFPLNWFSKKSGRDGYEIALKEWIGL